MRLHAVIAASLVCLPALPIPYYSKVPMIAKELGYNIGEMGPWTAFAAPAATPKETINAREKDVNRII